MNAPRIKLTDAEYQKALVDNRPLAESSENWYRQYLWDNDPHMVEHPEWEKSTQDGAYEFMKSIGVKPEDLPTYGDQTSRNGYIEYLKKNPG